MDPRLLRFLQRAWMLLVQATLVLPFVTAKGCDASQVREYTGFEIYLGGSVLGLLALPLLALLLVLFVFPFSGGSGWRPMVGLAMRAHATAYVALVAVFGPAFALLFDELTPRIGWWLHGGGWVATVLVYGIAAVAHAKAGGTWPRGRLRVATIALVAGPPAAVGIHALHDPIEGVDAVVGIVSGLALSVPLAIAACGLAKAEELEIPAAGERQLWWIATLVTLGWFVVGAASE